MAALLCLALLLSTAQAGTLSGTVVDTADGATPIYPVFIDLLVPETGAAVEGFGTDNSPDGSYEITGIPPGQYKVFFNAYDAAGAYADELYDGIECDNGTCGLDLLGDVLNLTEGTTVVNIDLSLRLSLSGRVTTELGQPMFNVSVEVLDISGIPITDSASTNPNGEWIKALPGPGTYYARINSEWIPGYRPEAWNDVPCDGCDVTLIAQPISVTDSGITGIDFELEFIIPPAPQTCNLTQVISKNGFEQQVEYQLNLTSARYQLLTQQWQNAEFTVSYLDGEGQPTDISNLEWCLEDNTLLFLTPGGTSATVTATGFEPISTGVIAHDPVNQVSVRGAVILGTEFRLPEDWIVACRYNAPVNVIDWTCEVKPFTEYGIGPIEQFVIKNPSLLFVNAEQRNLELAEIDVGTRNSWCQAHALSEIDLSAYTVPLPPEITEDNRYELDPMFRLQLYGRGLHQYLADPNAAGAMARSFLSWAQNGELLDIDFLDNNQGVRLDMWYDILAYMLAWEAIKDTVPLTEIEYAQIDDWLNAIAAKLEEYDGEMWGDVRLSNFDISNQSIVQDLGQMAYGILHDNDALFRRGIKKFFAVLDGMVRGDGSFVNESQRGGYALSYSVGSTVIMIRIAELAAQQGYDLYSVNVNGVSLLDVIEFSLNALEDPSLLNQYTQYQNQDICPQDCANWDNQIYDYSPSGFNFAEIEILKHRFPDSPLAERIESLFPEETYTPLQEGSLLQTCEFRQP